MGCYLLWCRCSASQLLVDAVLVVFSAPSHCLRPSRTCRSPCHRSTRALPPRPRPRTELKRKLLCANMLRFALLACLCSTLRPWQCSGTGNCVSTHDNAWAQHSDQEHDRPLPLLDTPYALAGGLRSRLIYAEALHHSALSVRKALLGPCCSASSEALEPLLRTDTASRDRDFAFTAAL